MGKKTSNLTGLSRYVLEALKASQEESTEVSDSKRHDADGETEPPAKRRKAGSIISRPEKYDATGLVPHYRDAYQVPEHLQKYFSQRKRYFSLYDEGCLLDEEGWFSVTPERVANQIAERCRCDTILDAFCGVGGNAIAFAKTCERVIALDIDPTRLALARHNAAIYGVADRIDFILVDYLTFIESYLSLPSGSVRKIDVIFLSPPWGGPSYLSGLPAESTPPLGSDLGPPSVEGHPEYSLASIRPIHGAKLFQLSRQVTCNIAYFLPRNTSLEEVSALLLQDGSDSGEMSRKDENADSHLGVVEIEEEWMGTKLKALTCYFGGLVGGQEHLF